MKMLKLVLVITCLLSLLSTAFGGQVFSTFIGNKCEPGIAAWTPWFNTQDPLINNGDEREDVATIRKMYQEAYRCTSIFNVEYSVIQQSNNELGSYRTLVNQTGLFCTGADNARCPNYRIRLCCPSIQQYSVSQCGITYQQPYLRSSLRIVNGYQAKPHSFPWAVSLQYRGAHDCGGVIIDQRHILTAAHCLDYSHDLGNYFARVGAHDRHSSGQLIPIAKLIVHPEYDEGRSVNDIGIIKLAQPIMFNNEIQPICLVENIIEPPLDATTYVVGWGNTVHQNWDTSSPVLLQARLRVISDCSMYFAYDAQKQLCAAPNGPAGQDHGSCQGDSGGGLFYYTNGRWYAGGVVSYAIGCGRQAFPTVFTKTAAYISWIRTMMNRPV